MAKIKRVNFLMHFNGPRLIGPLGIDVVAITAGSFIAIFTICTFASFKISITMILSMLFSYLATRSYIKACELSADGYFRQFLYMTGAWSVREDPAKFKELKKLDVKNFMPDATDKIFSE